MHRASWGALASLVAACGAQGCQVAHELPPPAVAPAPHVRAASRCGAPVSSRAPIRPRQALQSVATRRVTELAVSPDGRSLATLVPYAARVDVWDVATRRLTRTIPIPAPGGVEPAQIKWEDDRSLLVGEGEGERVYAIDVSGAHPTYELAVDGARAYFQGPYRWIRCAERACAFLDREGAPVARMNVTDVLPPHAFSADGKTLVVAEGAQLVVSRDRGGKLVEDERVPIAGAVREVAVDARGTLAALAVVKDGDEATSLELVSLTGAGAAPRALALPPRTTYVVGLQIGADGATLAARTIAEDADVLDPGALATWSLPAGTPSWQSRGLGDLAFAEGGRTLIARPHRQRIDHGLFVADEGPPLTVLEAASGRREGQIGAQGEALRAVDVAFAGDDRLLVAREDRVSVWSISSARRVAVYRVERPRAVGLSARGDVVVARSTSFSRCGGEEGIDVEVWSGIERPASLDDARPSRPGGEWPPPPGAQVSFCPPRDSEIALVRPDLGRALVQRSRSFGASWDSFTEDRPVPPRWADLSSGKVSPLADASPLERGSLALSQDGAFAVWANSSNGALHLRRWRLPTGDLDARVDDPSALSALRGDARPRSALHVAVAPDASSAVVYTDAGAVRYALPGGARDGAFASIPGATAVATSGDVTAIGREDGTLVARARGGGGDAPSDGGAIRSLAIAPSARRAASVGDDGVVRLWDARTARPLAALFETDDDEWAITTPHGAYVGTSEVATRLAWIFDAPLESFPYEQFSAAYRDADVVRRRLHGDDVDAEGIAQRPPSLSWVGQSKIAPDEVEVTVRARSTTRVDEVRAFVEGRPVARASVCAPDARVTLRLPLLRATNRATLVAFDDRGFASNPATLDVAGPSGGASLPDLWVVAVGVDRYEHLPPSAQLRVAVDDARGIAAAFASMRGRSYREVHARVLADGEVTPDSVLSALKALSGMAPADVGIVFLAGHGATLGAGGDMFFLTGGVQPDGRGGVSVESARAAGVGWSLVGRALAQARGRVLVLLDACHSGQITQELIVPNEALAEDLANEQRAGAIVFAAAKGRQPSFEPGNARGFVLDARTRAPGAAAEGDEHGFFTGALLAALRDRSTDWNGDGAIQVSELIDEVTTRVATATQGEQTPWRVRWELFGDFSIAAAPAAPIGGR